MRYLYLVITIVYFLGTGCNKKEEFDKQQMLSDIGTHIIMPAQDALVPLSEQLNIAIQAFIAQPTTTTLTNLQETWVATMEQWSKCALYNFGIVKERYLHWYVDRTPTNTTSLDNIFNSTDTIDAPFFDSQSSYNKGLPAIEYLIFREDAPTTLALYTTNTNAERYKIYLNFLGNDLEETCINIQTVWAEQGENYLNTFQSTLGDDIQGSISLLSNAIINLSRNITRVKLGKVMGKEAADGMPIPSLEESPFAHHSLRIIYQNIESLEDVFRNDNGIGLDDYLNHLTNEETISNQLLEKLATAKIQATAITSPLHEAVISEEENVEALYQTMRDIVILLEADVANNFGITVLASDSDGD